MSPIVYVFPLLIVWEISIELGLELKKLWQNLNNSVPFLFKRELSILSAKLKRFSFLERLFEFFYANLSSPLSL